MKIRGYLCWLLGHRYKAIWFKSHRADAPECQVGIADTEAGCVYCSYVSSNEFPMNVNDIDWKATSHRKSPPEHNTYKEDR